VRLRSSACCQVLRTGSLLNCVVTFKKSTARIARDVGRSYFSEHAIARRTTMNYLWFLDRFWAHWGSTLEPTPLCAYQAHIVRR
jgi:hypothetical protein